MKRKFTRVSLGGVHDEAEIRGHRRTYIGALPGTIIQAIRKAGSRDCVLMLDEIDKMGSGIHGDPSAALLEVLDPEQNGTFRDNYLDVPFDLSRVVFIATANLLETIPGPLRDRMEIIALSGYTAGEKLEIAKRYLVRRQLEANGLKAGQAEVEDAALRRIIEGYTREAGVRSLEREIVIPGPAGATPREGRSAGVAMFMALPSLFPGRPIRSDTAMTGEISLRGLVLPVGGIKEKVVAAHGAGLKRVMLPARNRRDYDDIPEEVRSSMEFIWLERVEDAVAQALQPA